MLSVLLKKKRARPTGVRMELSVPFANVCKTKQGHPHISHNYAGLLMGVIATAEVLRPRAILASCIPVDTSKPVGTNSWYLRGCSTAKQGGFPVRPLPTLVHRPHLRVTSLTSNLSHANQTRPCVCLISVKKHMRSFIKSTYQDLVGIEQTYQRLY